MTTDRPDEQIEAAAKVLREMTYETPYGTEQHSVSHRYDSRCPWCRPDIDDEGDGYTRIARALSAAGLLATPADQDSAIWALADRANFYQRAWESMRGRLGHEMDLRKRAEAERDLLRAQVTAMRSLHKPEQACCNPQHTAPDTTCPECIDACMTCQWEYPCPTIRALDTAGGDQHGE